jgi:hypothetical protein
VSRTQSSAATSGLKEQGAHSRSRSMKCSTEPGGKGVETQTSANTRRGSEWKTGAPSVLLDNGGNRVGLDAYRAQQYTQDELDCWHRASEEIATFVGPKKARETKRAKKPDRKKRSKKRAVSEATCEDKAMPGKMKQESNRYRGWPPRARCQRS